jgi:hypothetical protein
MEDDVRQAIDNVRDEGIRNCDAVRDTLVTEVCWLKESLARIEASILKQEGYWNVRIDKMNGRIDKGSVGNWLKELGKRIVFVSGVITGCGIIGYATYRLILFLLKVNIIKP